MGRKGRYEEWLTKDNLLRIEGWARDGLTKEQIAHNIGIHIGTLCEWQKRFPEFHEALKRGSEPVDILVENALLKRALGYEYEETTTEIIQTPYTDKNGNQQTKEQKHIRKVVKTVMPDTTAQIFWLKNRRPDKWRDRQEQIVATFEDLTPLAELLK